jgi:hypothetical protein
LCIYTYLHVGPVCHSGSGGYAGEDSKFLCPRATIRWVQLRARGRGMAPVSAPIGFPTRGYTDIWRALPSLVGIATSSCLDKNCLLPVGFFHSESHVSCAYGEHLAVFAPVDIVMSSRDCEVCHLPPRVPSSFCII